MILLALIATALAVGFSGPDGRAWFARRRCKREQELARVVYLPSAACRPRSRD